MSWHGVSATSLVLPRPPHGIPGRKNMEIHGGNRAIFMRFQGNITIFDRQATTVDLPKMGFIGD